MRRALLVGVTVCLVLVAAVPASAAIKIRKIVFDPAGEDTGDAGHLRKEIIVIKNNGSRAVTIDGWKLHDRGRDHTYVFGDRGQDEDAFADITLGPGEYLRLHTGRGQDSGTTGCNGHCFTYYDFYWDLENYVWNNAGDRARLIRPNGNVVDSCAYTASADSPKAC